MVHAGPNQGSPSGWQSKDDPATQTLLAGKVENGLATIKQRTEILTPITDAKVKSQVIQRIQHGYLKFDIQAGRLFNSRLELDERVIGFNGPTSHMHYLGRLTEQSELVRDGVRKVSVR